MINNRGELRLADFGLARDIPEDNTMTMRVVTLWYRPPELLLQDTKYCKYTTAVDMWGVGCIFGEMWKRRAILRGSEELEQLTLYLIILPRIFKLIGTPTDREWPEMNDLPLLKSGKVKSFANYPFSLGDIFPKKEY